MNEHLTPDPLDLDALLRETGGVDAGALVVFSGVIRAHDRDRPVAALEYDAHLRMAAEVIRRIEEEMLERDGVLACRIVHRTGEVAAGEPSVHVVVRARHRAEAFETARDAIDRVKQEAPIWKADVAPDGSRQPHPPSSGTPLVPPDEPQE